MFVIVLFSYEIRGRYHCLFKQGFGGPTVHGAFLARAKRHREKLLDNNIAMFVIVLFLYEIRGRYHYLFKQGFGGPTVHGAFLARAQEAQGEVAGQQYNHTSSCYKSIKGYTNGLPTRILQRAIAICCI